MTPRSAFSAAGWLICFAVQIQAAEQDRKFEGTVKATLTRAGAPTEFLFTCKGDQLRLEDPAKDKSEPINLIELASGKLTIIFPHNSSFTQVAPVKTPWVPGTPPPNFPAPPNIPAGPAGARPVPAIPLPPSFPSLPPMPALPPMPNNPAAGGPPAFPMPMMLPMPAMPGVFGASQLKKTDQTRTIQGMECTLYTLSDPGQNFEIWAVGDAVLFPFRLLERDSPTRRFGRPMIEDQWVELLQTRSLFPLEATLRSEPGGEERLSFKVTHIERKKIDEGTLFSVPKDFYEIQPPQF